MSTPVVLPPTTKAVQRKVSFSAIGTYLGGLIVTTLIQGLQDGSLLSFLPPTASAIVAPVVPALIALGVGYVTTNRVSPEDTKAFVNAVQEQAMLLVEAKVADAIAAAFTAQSDVISTNVVRASQADA